MTICLSAGHGAGDPGVVYKNLQEQYLTMAIVKAASAIIRKHSTDCLEVPDDLTLVETIQWINNRTSQINIAVEVHINSGVDNAHGAEGWNYEGAGTLSDKLSQYLVDAVSVESGLTNRGIIDETLNRYRKLGFIHDTNPVAALIECGFIQGDYDLLNSPEGIYKIAKGVARGCLQYLGIAWRPELLTPSVPTPSPAPVNYQAMYEAERKRTEDLEREAIELRKRPASCPPQRDISPIKTEILNAANKL